MVELIWPIFGILVFIAGLLDAWKQRFLTRKILRYKTTSGVSRLFINYGILHKTLLTIWAGFYLNDWVVTLASILALWTSVELWWVTYLHYPYKFRGRKNFKRPSIIKYVINSWIPNKYAERL